MNALVVTNTKQAVKVLLDGPPPFGDLVTSIAKESGNGLGQLFRKGSLTASPIFLRSQSDVMCAQDGFFGFYLLCHAIRACLASVNFQIAGSMTAESQLYGPAVALFYTSAYHAFSGFLAINGHVLIDSEGFTWVSANHKPSVIAGCLTRDNKWKYEARSRSHARRWLELRELIGRGGFEIPPYFRVFFRQIFPTLRKKGATILDIINNPEQTMASLEENMEKFLRRIAEIRHVALYRSYGEDPHVVEALVNKETISTAALGFQAEAVGVFAQSLLSETARAVRDLITPIRIPNDLRPFMYLGTGQPWTDRPRTDLWFESTLREDIAFIYEWLVT